MQFICTQSDFQMSKNYVSMLNSMLNQLLIDNYVFLMPIEDLKEHSCVQILKSKVYMRLKCCKLCSLNKITHS